MSKIPLELILYKYNFEDVVFVAEYFSYENGGNIENCKLTIKSFDDVDITSQEIISVIGEKPGPWIKSVTSELEHEILLNRLNNNRKDILDFLLKIRDNK